MERDTSSERDYIQDRGSDQGRDGPTYTRAGGEGDRESSLGGAGGEQAGSGHSTSTRMNESEGFYVPPNGDGDESSG
jgi:hypothetical protein